MHSPPLLVARLLVSMVVIAARLLNFKAARDQKWKMRIGQFEILHNLLLLLRFSHFFLNKHYLDSCKCSVNFQSLNTLILMAFWWCWCQHSCCFYAGLDLGAPESDIVELLPIPMCLTLLSLCI
jgi:hypothetical protein